MSLCNCDKCGRLFLAKWESRCTSCSQLVLKDTHKVKDFVREHPRATLIEIYNMTGVPLQTIKELMRA
ncbi:hypothetical protein A8709_26280 [Paenibacillus pectinilyticus]|uniref:Flagellar protein n=1 Tax=Paenibacillus pectinilyticus TaxID=512399 RepID=A0A1C1A1D1_9BACL|nr:hypothetical protein A8709_26280 [Paenibacillus pectinilyticus]